MSDVKPPKGWKFVDEPAVIVDGFGACWHDDGGPHFLRVDQDIGADWHWLAPDDTPPPRRWEADDGSGWWEECNEPHGQVDGVATAMFENGEARLIFMARSLGRWECWVRFVPKEK